MKSHFRIYKHLAILVMWSSHTCEQESVFSIFNYSKRETFAWDGVKGMLLKFLVQIGTNINQQVI